MSDVPSLLQPLKDRLAAATDAAPVPWQAVGTGVRGGDHWYICAEGQSIASIACHDGENEEQREPLARLFAAAPTDQAKLIAAIERVLEVHETIWVAGPDGNGSKEWCPSCLEYSPCNTVAALTQALGGDGE